MADVPKISFEDLSFKQKISHFHDVAKKATQQWNFPKDSQLKLLNFSENATFLIQHTENGKNKKIIMRVHRLEYATLNSINSEISFILHLKKNTPLDITSPILSKNGRYVESIETAELNEIRNVDCFEFAEGKTPVDTSDSVGNIDSIIKSLDTVPDFITVAAFKGIGLLDMKLGGIYFNSKLTTEDRNLYKTLGRIIAQIHSASKSWKKPEYFQRMEWDFEGTFGKRNNFYGEHYANKKWVSKHDEKILDNCTQLIKKRLEIYGKTPARYGMIHSDLRFSNLLQNGSAITVLDFDDSGMGWYMYDFAGALTFLEHRHDIKELILLLITGYEEIMPLSNEDKNEIWTFIIMRRIGMLQSLLFRQNCVAAGVETADLTPEILGYYEKTTVELAKEYLHTYKITNLQNKTAYKEAV